MTLQLAILVTVTCDITNSQYCMACMYRLLHAMPRYCSARESQIYYNIDSFYALQRKVSHKFIETVNYLRTFGLKRPVKTLMSSDCFYDSIYYDYYCGILYVNE